MSLYKTHNIFIKNFYKYSNFSKDEENEGRFFKLKTMLKLHPFLKRYLKWAEVSLSRYSYWIFSNIFRYSPSEFAHTSVRRTTSSPWGHMRKMKFIASRDFARFVRLRANFSRTTRIFFEDELQYYSYHVQPCLRNVVKETVQHMLLLIIFTSVRVCFLTTSRCKTLTEIYSNLVEIENCYTSAMLFCFDSTFASSVFTILYQFKSIKS